MKYSKDTQLKFCEFKSGGAGSHCFPTDILLTVSPTATAANRPCSSIFSVPHLGVITEKLIRISGTCGLLQKVTALNIESDI